MQQDALQVGRRVEEEDLLVGLAVLGNILHVVVAHTQVENVAAGEFVTRVAVVEVFRSAQNEADGVTRKGLGLDPVVKCFHILHNHRLLGR